MGTDRVFSDEELRCAGLRTVDAFEEALGHGDRDAARRLGRRLRREATSMHANYAGWEATLSAWIAENGRPEDVEQAGAAVAAKGGTLPPDLVDEAGLRPRWKAAERAIDAALARGEDAEARRLAQALHDEALLVHDRGMARVSALLSWLGRRFGTDALEAAYARAMSADLLGDASFRERAEALMHFTRVHLQPFELVEDDEKLTFLCAVCPSGGRLLREGSYSEPDPDLVVKGPHRLTWGRDALPVYCAHEPVMERSSILATGVPLFVVEPSDELGVQPCRTYLYKDPDAIPEHYYTRVGLEKPKRR